MAEPSQEFSDRLRETLEPAVRPFFPEEFVVCCEWFDRFTTEVAARDLARLDLDREFETPTSAEEALARRGYVPRAAICLRWMLEKMAADDYFEVVREGDRPRFRRRVPLPADPETSRAKSLAIDPSSAPAFTVVDQLSEHIVEYFRGEKTGEEILFSPSRLSLWFDYFNNENLLYAVNNRLGAEAVTRALPATHPATILEIGGGAGSAAAALLERLEADGLLSRVERYIFTEPVPTFLRRGERMLRQRFPAFPIQVQKLDMNLPFSEQGIAPGSVDLLYAVNTVHVAKNLSVTLGHIFQSLKPGGRAVFSECIRPFPGQPIYVEYAFNFLENFVNVELDPEVRPTHGFLTPGNWRAALSRAGFGRVELLPDVERFAARFPRFFVAAILAARPA